MNRLACALTRFSVLGLLLRCGLQRRDYTEMVATHFTGATKFYSSPRDFLGDVQASVGLPPRRQLELVNCQSLKICMASRHWFGFQKNSNFPGSGCIPKFERRNCC